MRSLKIAGALALGALLAGCAPHWTSTQCTNIDMKQQGIMDGRTGMASSHFAKYQTDCNKYAINLDRSQYLIGWKDGNREFCQSNNLYEVGKSGKSYPSVCDMRQAQRDAYNRGRRRYTEINDIRMQIATINGQLNKTQSLQQEYNDTINRIASDRADISVYRKPKDDYERDRLRNAKADLAAQKIKARTLHDQVIAANAVEMATPEKRRHLMQRKARLERRLSNLQAST